MKYIRVSEKLDSQKPKKDFPDYQDQNPAIEVQGEIKGFSWPRRILYADLHPRRIQSSTVLGIILILVGIFIAAGMAALGFFVAFILDSIVS